MRVLDTAALLHYPLTDLVGYAHPDQLRELQNLAPERTFLVESSPLEWRLPSQESLTQATEIAQTTGDLGGLSATDLAILALVLEVGGALVTDDYRLQNCCTEAGVEFLPVMTEGISEAWSWVVLCPGCGARSEASDTSSRKGDLGECKRCGTGLKLKKVRQ